MSALTPKADIQGLAQNYIFRIWPDVRFRGQSGRKSLCGCMSASSQKRTSSGASEVQNWVYGKTPLKQLIRPQEATYRFLREVFLGAAFFAAGFRFFGLAVAFFFGLITAFVFFGLAGAASASITP